MKYLLILLLACSINSFAQDSTTVKRKTGEAFSGGGVSTVNSGSGITVDNTDPVNPIINFSGVSGGANFGFVSVMDYGADSTASRGSAINFINAIASGKSVYVPPGRYLLNGVDSALTLNTGQTIFGLGDRSTLVTTTHGSTASLTAAANVFILSNPNSTVRDLRIVGDGKTTYVYPWTSQNGVWTYADYNSIINCTFDSLRGSGILGVEPSVALFVYNRMEHNRFKNCTVGNFNYGHSEYWNIVGNTWELNDIGSLEYGGNNVYNGSVYRFNHLHIEVTGDNHGGWNGGVMNHATGSPGVKLTSINIEELFTGMHFFDTNFLISESERVIFTGCAFGGGTITATATTAKTVLVTACTMYSSPTFTTSGTSAVITLVNNN